ncbi:hypothetical protein [Haloferax sulfurifontis]|uniref:Uncharacterized protein n=1 Tax=Haloferax sulfurifontis TaxID=255616 RepID=A0A830DTY4_9EURY|nr:hypothetical protein [Haloferax sulfurifontis]GGC49793.1 hypothetical protein GCM10007209_09330 [Haloferax sulfurifontis]
MTTVVRAVAVALLLSLVVSASVPVGAQEGTTTPTTPPNETTTSTPTATPTETPTPDNGGETQTPGGGQADGLNVTAEDLWKVFKESEDAEKPSENRILKQIGPNLYVTDAEWDNDAGLVEVTIRARVTTRVTITDATGVFNGDNVGDKQSVTVPRGTYTLVLPATPSDQDPTYQAISFDPGDGHVYGLESKDSPDGGQTFFDSNRPMWVWFLYFAGGFLALGALSFVYRLRKMDTGTPYTSDGIKLPKRFRFGIEAVEDDDEHEKDGESA